MQGNRRLKGDLFYLDMATPEGCTICVTARPDGFVSHPLAA